MKLKTISSEILKRRKNVSLKSQEINGLNQEIIYLSQQAQHRRHRTQQTEQRSSTGQFHLNKLLQLQKIEEIHKQQTLQSEQLKHQSGFYKKIANLSLTNPDRQEDDRSEPQTQSDPLEPKRHSSSMHPSKQKKKSVLFGQELAIEALKRARSNEKKETALKQ